jgi:hypothetical protein
LGSKWQVLDLWREVLAAAGVDVWALEYNSESLERAWVQDRDLYFREFLIERFSHHKIPGDYRRKQSFSKIEDQNDEIVYEVDRYEDDSASENGSDGSEDDMQRQVFLDSFLGDFESPIEERTNEKESTGDKEWREPEAGSAEEAETSSQN